MIRGHIVSTLDGYVAEDGNGAGFPAAFEGMDPGHEAFLAGIDTVVLGRATYDQLVRSGAGWSYGGKRAFVVTSRPLGDAHDGVEAWHDGVDALVQRLRGEPGQAWVVGGPRLLGSFLDRGALDRLELFVLPLRLGGGVPLFPPCGQSQTLLLREVQRLDLGVVKLDYEPQSH